MRRFLLPILLIEILLSGCFSGTQKSKDQIIFVSILPLKYFADKIVGNTYKVEVTVPPGVGPETYSPTPKQMIMLGAARVLNRHGLKISAQRIPNSRFFQLQKGLI
jgi:zinc transport system substrate-binding protein